MKQSTEIYICKELPVVEEERIYRAKRRVIAALSESPFWYARSLKDRLELIEEILVYFI